MHWKNIHISSITTKDIFYFSEPYVHVCERVCGLLDIDQFPDIDSLNVFYFENGSWTKNKHVGNNTLQNTDVFDEEILEQMIKSKSNLLFFDNGKFIDEILHFTNYDTCSVFRNLYENFHVFETNLRKHLWKLGYDYNSFKAFYQYKYEKTKQTFWKDKINKINDPKFNKKIKDAKTLDELLFSDLLHFALSSYHTNEKLLEIGVKTKGKVSAVKINDLRNMVMHSKSISGEDQIQLHYFNHFKAFFDNVLNFKLAFNNLKDTLNENSRNYIKHSNKQKLKLLDELSDKQILEYFI